MSKANRHRIVGDCAKGQIEIRYEGRDLDEIVARDAHVHLEMMSDQNYALIIETARERGCYFIYTKNGRAHLKASESWRDPVNRRKEAATRRENAKKHKRQAPGRAGRA